MLTLFTTTKGFKGHFKLIQINAINSWFKLKIPVQVIIFGHSEGIEEILSDHPILYIPDIRAKDNKIPFINEMFAKASEVANYPLLCFLNADIILHDQFIDTILKVTQLAKKDYLIVGQRLDVDITESIVFVKDWDKYVLRKYKNESVIHPPAGSDYFIFPRGQYSLENIPDLLVGRPGWDLWMIFNARQRRLKAIDISFETIVIHQNHDYSHKEIVFSETGEDPDSNFNTKNITGNIWYLFTLMACNYFFLNNKIRRNYYRCENMSAYLTEINFINKSNLFKRKFLYYWIKLRNAIIFSSIKKPLSIYGKYPPG